MKHNAHKYWNKFHLMDFTQDNRYEIPINFKKEKQRLFRRKIKREDYNIYKELR